MKDGAWLPGDLETKGHSLPPDVYTSQVYGLGAGTKLSDRNLCIPCALTNHDFKERIPTLVRHVLDEEHTPKAWIDGHRFRMVYHSSQRRATCTDCGDKVHIVYEPER